MTSMAVIVYATSMVTSLGAVTMAAHEILRQVWIISIQAFMALDICAQSMVASFLGHVSRLSISCLPRKEKEKKTRRR